MNIHSLVAVDESTLGDFLTMAEYAAYFNVTEPTTPTDPDYVMAQMYIESASSAIESYLGTPIRRGIYQTHIPETCEDLLIFGKNISLEDTASGVVYGTDTWVKRADGKVVGLADLFVRCNQGVIEQCDCCCCLACGCRKCKYFDVRILAGWDPVPPCLKMAMLELIKMAIAERSAGISTAASMIATTTSGATGLIKSEKIGDYQIVFENFQDSTSSGGSGSTGCGCDDYLKKLSWPARQCLRKHKVYHFLI